MAVPPRLQVEFQLPQGIARVDFDWERVFGEFDGRVKYDDAGVLSGLSDQQVYWNEKRREERGVIRKGQPQRSAKSPRRAA